MWLGPRQADDDWGGSGRISAGCLYWNRATIPEFRQCNTEIILEPVEGLSHTPFAQLQTSKETLEFMRLSLDLHLVTVPAFERRGYGCESSR